MWTVFVGAALGTMCAGQFGVSLGLLCIAAVVWAIERAGD